MDKVSDIYFYKKPTKTVEEYAWEIFRRHADPRELGDKDIQKRLDRSFVLAKMFVTAVQKHYGEKCEK